MDDCKLHNTEPLLEVLSYLKIYTVTAKESRNTSYKLCSSNVVDPSSFLQSTQLKQRNLFKNLVDQKQLSNTSASQRLHRKLLEIISKIPFSLVLTKEKVSCLHEHIEISAIYTVSLMMAGDPLKCCPVPVFRPPFQSVPTVGSNFQERQGWVGRGDLSQDSFFQQQF